MPKAKRPFLDPEYCGVCNKKIYHVKNEALQALHAMRRHLGRGTHHNTLQPYKCLMGYWHLGNEKDE